MYTQPTTKSTEAFSTAGLATDAGGEASTLAEASANVAASELQQEVDPTAFHNDARIGADRERRADRRASAGKTGPAGTARGKNARSSQSRPPKAVASKTSRGSTPAGRTASSKMAKAEVSQAKKSHATTEGEGAKLDEAKIGSSADLLEANGKHEESDAALPQEAINTAAEVAGEVASDGMGILDTKATSAASIATDFTQHNKLLTKNGFRQS